jgi:hypothetical protein
VLLLLAVVLLTALFPSCCCCCCRFGDVLSLSFSSLIPLLSHSLLTGLCELVAQLPPPAAEGAAAADQLPTADINGWAVAAALLQVWTSY